LRIPSLSPAQVKEVKAPITSHIDFTDEKLFGEMTVASYRFISNTTASYQCDTIQQREQYREKPHD
jgi:hypothetical protein